MKRGVAFSAHPPPYTLTFSNILKVKRNKTNKN
jgi:hypothetical protein